MTLYVATVHWRDDRWVDIQLDYLKRNLGVPFRICAFLNELPRDHRHKYYYASSEPIGAHATKLNLLADLAARDSKDHDDWLLFLDGDAFPIRDVAAYAREKFARFPLMAIQRLENAGDVQPHPSFCLTTIKFWRAISGDWSKGFRWRNASGAFVTDVGGNLLNILDNRSIQWHRMLRSNALNIHPVLFGVYDGIVYHHGAGFREPISRYDLFNRRSLPRSRLPCREASAIVNGSGGEAGGEPRYSDPDPGRGSVENNKLLSEHVINLISSDPLFFRVFEDAPGAKAPFDAQRLTDGTEASSRY